MAPLAAFFSYALDITFESCSWFDEGSLRKLVGLDLSLKGALTEEVFAVIRRDKDGPLVESRATVERLGTPGATAEEGHPVTDHVPAAPSCRPAQQ